MSQANTYYWVYILEADAKPRYTVYHALNRPAISENLSGKLIYSRSFDNLIDSLGHKLLMEQLSEASITRIIRANEQNE